MSDECPKCHAPGGHTATDFFGSRRLLDGIDLPRQVLAAAQRILDLTDVNPEMLAGDTMSPIDRRLRLDIWLEDGLYEILTMKRGSIVQAFTRWSLDPNKGLGMESIGRARRWLVEHSVIAVSDAARADAARQYGSYTKRFRAMNDEAEGE
jgi:hypothetical protein